MVGENTIRIDAYDKATGNAKYVSDLKSNFPQLLHIKILRSPYAHARIVKLDLDKAKKMEGVVKIITGKEEDVSWEAFPPQSRLAMDEAVWAGQGIAIVAAKTAQIAQEAVNCIHVEYEKLPYVLTWQDSFEENPANVVDKNRKFKPSGRTKEFTYPNVAGEYHLLKGDINKGFEEAEVIAEGEFWAGKKSHNQLERAAAISQYNTDGSITTWCNGCGIHGVIRKTLDAAFEVPFSKIRIINPYTGGSFGNRNIAYVEVITFLMALKTKGTVFLEFTREEMFTASPSNWVCATKVKLGADKNGKLTAKEIRLIEEMGASIGNTNYTGRLSASSTANTYSVPNVYTETCSLLTNTVPAGPYRGLGTPDAVFGLELLMNDIARQLKISPLEIRLRNIIERGGEDDYGGKITSIGVSECLEQVAKAVELDTPSVQDGTVWKRGKGIACCGKQNGPNGRSEAEVLVFHDGSVQVLVSCDNHGMGASTTMVQIASEELQIPANEIQIVIGDTGITPYDNFSASSSGLYRTGYAVKLACKDALRQLAKAAARYAGVPEDLVTVKGNAAHILGSSIESIPIQKLFAPLSMFNQNVWGLKQGTPVRGIGVFSPAQATPWDENGRTPRMWNWFQYAATAVEIAVNTETGQIKVEKIANAGDTGYPVNPKIIESQLEGTAHMAIGFSLNEEHIYNNNGAIWNANLSDYRLPLSTELPELSNVVPIICPDPLPDGPYGAKGMSESVVSAVGAAIAGALYDAVGIKVYSYPMTAERVLEEIQNKGE